ncbi:unnamed protein product [Vitrella brassicaformis CCMP3155]|uniref:Uncharacterized protein n=3 Tax=Vitrella brassicaformis TaxID=1169539 RepID=A0A0G4FPZ0_VITBC|nr:unnamed protein product [Vitrella brassicaformis CCMP3155]|eukprot:CEM15854.1 unnamed protein product [Vitrella brassicaformis CCMP3155]
MLLRSLTALIALGGVVAAAAGDDVINVTSLLHGASQSLQVAVHAGQTSYIRLEGIEEKNHDDHGTVRVVLSGGMPFVSVLGVGYTPNMSTYDRSNYCDWVQRQHQTTIDVSMPIKPLSPPPFVPFPFTDPCGVFAFRQCIVSEPQLGDCVAASLKGTLHAGFKPPPDLHQQQQQQQQHGNKSHHRGDDKKGRLQGSSGVGKAVERCVQQHATACIDRAEGRRFQLRSSSPECVKQFVLTLTPTVPIKPHTTDQEQQQQPANDTKRAACAAFESDYAMCLVRGHFATEYASDFLDTDDVAETYMDCTTRMIDQHKQALRNATAGNNRTIEEAARGLTASVLSRIASVCAGQRASDCLKHPHTPTHDDQEEGTATPPPLPSHNQTAPPAPSASCLMHTFRNMRFRPPLLDEHPTVETTSGSSSSSSSATIGLLLKHGDLQSGSVFVSCVATWLNGHHGGGGDDIAIDTDDIGASRESACHTLDGFIPLGALAASEPSAPSAQAVSDLEVYPWSVDSDDIGNARMLIRLRQSLPTLLHLYAADTETDEDYESRGEDDTTRPLISTDHRQLAMRSTNSHQPPRLRAPLLALTKLPPGTVVLTCRGSEATTLLAFDQTPLERYQRAGEEEDSIFLVAPPLADLAGDSVWYAIVAPEDTEGVTVTLMKERPAHSVPEPPQPYNGPPQPAGPSHTNVPHGAPVREHPPWETQGESIGSTILHVFRGILVAAGILLLAAFLGLAIFAIWTNFQDTTPLDYYHSDPEGLGASMDHNMHSSSLNGTQYTSSHPTGPVVRWLRNRQDDLRDFCQDLPSRSSIAMRALRESVIEPEVAGSDDERTRLKGGLATRRAVGWDRYAFKSHRCNWGDDEDIWRVEEGGMGQHDMDADGHGDGHHDDIDYDDDSQIEMTTGGRRQQRDASYAPVSMTDEEPSGGRQGASDIGGEGGRRKGNSRQVPNSSNRSAYAVEYNTSAATRTHTNTSDNAN